jgi:hypothetical protein
MIWNTAVVSLLLSSSGAAVKAVKHPTKKQLTKELVDVHVNNVKLLKNNVAKAIKHPVSVLAGSLGGVTHRDLVDNTKFLNWGYHSDWKCDAASYGLAGYGADACIPNSNGVGAFKVGCTTDGSNVDVTAYEYSTLDCSSAITMTSSYTIDGTCSYPDDDFFDDDRLEPNYDGFTFHYETVTCDSTRPVGSWFDRTAYSDDACNTLTGYIGWNTEACFPYENIYLKLTSDCARLTSYTDSLCTNQFDFIDDSNPDASAFDVYCQVADDYAIAPGEYNSQVLNCENPSDDDVCFPGTETVTLQSGTMKTMAHVEVGDMVDL